MGQENFLNRKLEERKVQDALRRLRLPDGKADFCSNDYLGVVTKGLLAGAVGDDDAQALAVVVNAAVIDGREDDDDADDAATQSPAYGPGHASCSPSLSLAPGSYWDAARRSWPRRAASLAAFAQKHKSSECPSRPPRMLGKM